MALHQRCRGPFVARLPPLDELRIAEFPSLACRRLGHPREGRRTGLGTVKVRRRLEFIRSVGASLTGSGGNVERIGHRGAPRRFLENTLPSFEEALRQGADAIELDVHVASDGLVVVHHDPNLSGRVAPAGLRRRLIGDLSSAEITSVDLGGGSRVPSLAEVLAVVRGKATAYVEVKAGNLAPIVADIRASGASCAIHSFDHAAVAEVARLAPDIPRGILLDAWPGSLRDVLDATGARDVWPGARLITEARIAEIHALGRRAIVWTVNEPRLATQLRAWGIDGICTDDLTVV